MNNSSAHTLTALPPTLPSNWPKNYKNSGGKKIPVCTKRIWKGNQKKLENLHNKQSR